ncbi:hypothetical protein NFJ02_31g80910 [Pycnococcus provasolii]
MILFIHTDDGKFGYLPTAKSFRDKFVTALNKRFNIGATKVGIDRIFNLKLEFRKDGNLKLSQRKYVEDLMLQYSTAKKNRCAHALFCLFYPHSCGSPDGGPRSYHGFDPSWRSTPDARFFFGWLKSAL